MKKYEREREREKKVRKEKRDECVKNLCVNAKRVEFDILSQIGFQPYRVLRVQRTDNTWTKWSLQHLT